MKIIDQKSMAPFEWHKAFLMIPHSHRQVAQLRLQLDSEAGRSLK